MRLTSSAFESKGRVPVRYTCDGADVSPPLAWTDPPCWEPELRADLRPIRMRQGACGIPAATRALPEDWLPTRKSRPQAINAFRRAGYGGPCPRRGDATHHYRFRVHATECRRTLGEPPIAATSTSCPERI